MADLSQKFDENILQLREKDCIKKLAAAFARNKFNLDASKKEIRAVVYNCVEAYKLRVGYIEENKFKRNETIKRFETIKEESNVKKKKKKGKKKKPGVKTRTKKNNN